MSSRSEVDSGSSGADLLRSASKTAEDGDPQIRSILTQLLSAAKQPPRTRIRLKIEDIYYLLTLAKQVFQSKSALVEIEVCLCCFFVSFFSCLLFILFAVVLFFHFFLLVFLINYFIIFFFFFVDPLPSHSLTHILTLTHSHPFIIRHPSSFVVIFMASTVIFFVFLKLVNHLQKNNVSVIPKNYYF